MPIALSCVLSLLPVPQQPLPRPRPVFEPALELRDGPGALPIVAQTATVGSRVVLAFSEAATGQDLNGDGDLLDGVWHVVDLETGARLNLGLASSILPPVTSPESPWVLLGVGESPQGQDLNGDGDLLDVVGFALDPVTGTTRSSGLAVVFAFGTPLLGDHALLAVSEAAQGGDLDGDGVLGVVGYRWDLAGNDAPVGVGLPLGGFSGSNPVVAAHAGFFLVGVPEAPGAVDRNGDGDASDVVLHAIQATTGAVANAALAIAVAPSMLRESLQARGAYSVTLVSESAQSTDLNGDGDLADDVPFVFGPHGFRNVGIALGSAPISLGHGGFANANGMILGDETLLLLAWEARHGGADLNGDGDADDSVLIAHDLATGTNRSLGRAAFRSVLAEPLIVYQAREDQQGTDWNGDGDLDDLVLHAFDLARDRHWNTGLVRDPTDVLPVVDGRWFATAADVDADGDGFPDRALVLADARARRLHPLDLAPLQLRFQPGGVLSASVSESLTGRDLDEDGDLADTVLHLVWPGLGEVVGTGVPGSPLDGDGLRIPFTAFESQDATDHTGDGDATDQALRILRVRLR